MKKGVHAFLLAAGAAVLMFHQTAGAAGASSPIVGNWELDAAKSSASGGAALTSGHVAITSTKDGFKSVVDLVPASGAPMHYESTGRLDGKDVAVSGNTYFDSYTMLQVDKHTLIRTERHGGKVVGISTFDLAKDGKSFSVSTKATLPDGHRMTRTSVWNRAKKKK